MKKKIKNNFSSFFNIFSARVTQLAGRPSAFVSAMIIVIVWASLGPILNYSESWQLVINTGTTIITFLMVFVIQQSQNRDTMAIQLKLNELIAASKGASNRLVDIEELPEEELRMLKQFYFKLSKLAEKEENLFATHSVEEARENQEEKSADKQVEEKKQGKKTANKKPIQKKKKNILPKN